MIASRIRFAAAAWLTIGIGQAQEAGATAVTDRLLVCNKVDSTLTMLDPAAGTEIAVLPTGEAPHEVAVSPDGRTAVVSDYGAKVPGHTLTVVDVAAAKVVRTIDLVWTEPGSEGATEKRLLRPHGSRFLDDRRLVVTSEMGRRLVFVDVADGKVTRTLATPQATMHMVAGIAGRDQLAATSVTDGTLALFDAIATGKEPPRVVATGKGAEGLAMRPGTGEVWVGNRGEDTVSVVDPAKGEVVATLTTSGFPFRIAFTADGARALVSCAEGGEVLVFDAASRAQRQAISITGDGSELSAMPMGLCVDPEGRFCYVACGRGEFVAVLDLAKGATKTRLRAGRGPDGIAYARLSAPATTPTTTGK